MNGVGTEDKYFGKYRGTVINNIDPLNIGRLLVEVPEVLSLAPSSWALPCVPLAGPTGPPMGVYMVPPIGAGVWVEFEHGDAGYPIWVGCRFGTVSDVPTVALAGLPGSPSIVLQTLGQKHDCDQRRSGSARRNHSQEHDRGNHNDQRTGHHSSERSRGLTYFE